MRLIPTRVPEFRPRRAEERQRLEARAHHLQRLAAGLVAENPNRLCGSAGSSIRAARLAAEAVGALRRRCRGPQL